MSTIAGGRIAMFYYRLSDRHELRLLQTADAQELFTLTNINRTHLRQWLPWLDSIDNVANTRNFIESMLEQFRNALKNNVPD